MYLFFFFFFNLQLVCEEVNVDRFYPVLYPKVSPTPMLPSEALPGSMKRADSKLLMFQSGVEAYCHV